MSSFRTNETTSATKWVSYAAGSLPVVFEAGKFPKAIFTNEAQNVTLIGEDGNSVTFTPAIGVPIQLRPKELNSISGATIICLFG